MKPPECPLCRSVHHRFAFSERGYRLLHCDDCDLFYIDPYPSDQDQYRTVAAYDYEQLQIVGTERHYRSSQMFYRKYLPLILQRLGSAKAVLDVGCGTGHLLELLGRDPQRMRVGLELNAERAAFARKVAACPVHEVPVEDFPSDRPFDAVFLMNVLSHVPRIDQLFAALRRLLAADGQVMLKVGEMTRQVKKHAVHDWDIPDHLHFLGMQTMDVICRKFGFRVLLHQREPLSQELFDRDTWRAAGRSRVRNAIKRCCVATPLALPTLARIYDTIHGQSCFTSFVCLGLDPDWRAHP